MSGYGSGWREENERLVWNPRLVKLGHAAQVAAPGEGVAVPDVRAQVKDDTEQACVVIECWH